MKRTRIILLFLFISLFPACIRSQQEIRTLVGNCEGCEAVFEYSARQLSTVDTLPDFNEEGTRINVKGTVYKPDGITPAGDVILYIYHTNQDGTYESRENAKGYGKKHGYIRGWVKTGKNGKYSFYTQRPGSYPSGNEPAHIHLTIAEPNGRYYWLGSYHFADDPLLTRQESSPSDPRGGSSGLLNLENKDGILTGTRDLILGRNIPGY